MNNPRHPAHRALKDLLNGELGRMFLESFFKSVMPYFSGRICYRTIEEYPIPVPGGINVNGSPYAITDFIDFIFIIRPRENSVYDRTCFTIGLEIKTTFCDIHNAISQSKKYKGHVDYFLIITADNLINQTIEKVKEYDWIGVASFNTGKIHKRAPRLNVQEQHRTDMLLRLAFCHYQYQLQRLPIGMVKIEDTHHTQ